MSAKPDTEVRRRLTAIIAGGPVPTAPDELRELIDGASVSESIDVYERLLQQCGGDERERNRIWYAACDAAVTR